MSGLCHKGRFGKVMKTARYWLVSNDGFDSMLRFTNKTSREDA